MLANVSKQIFDDIDEYCAETYDDGHRNHLGASLIGEECKRKLWYIFRWCSHEKFSGRMQRLFNRGHREEERFIEWLEGIGCKVWYENYDGLCYHPESDCYVIAKDENDLAMELERILPTDLSFKQHIKRAKADGVKFPQYRISDVNGHFGGSLDAIIQLPEKYGIENPVLGEFKTNGTGKGFNDLVTQGMAITKQQHFAQTSTYGSDEKYQLTHCLYLNINKNDDSIHCELVKLNWDLGKQMRSKAESIIFAETAPSRLSDNPTFWKCKYCWFSDICHKGAIVEKNCRSCKYAFPVENAEWKCSVFNGIIPKDFIKIGCNSYTAITLHK